MSTLQAHPEGALAERVTDVRALAAAVRHERAGVVVDQADDLRRHLIEQEHQVRVEAMTAGVPATRIEAAVTSTRAASHVLETLAGALSSELEDRSGAAEVVRFASRFLESAQSMLLPSPTVTGCGGRAGPGTVVALRGRACWRGTL